MERKRVEELQQFYQDRLFNKCLPYWLEHAVDKEHGGFYTCLDEQWTLYNRDKSVWFQGRGTWLFSRLYNTVEPRKEWLEAAKNGYEFLVKHCYDSDGRMFFTVTEDGRPLQKRRYYFSETFAVIALAEYAKASGDPAAMAKAVDTFELVERLYRNPELSEPKINPEIRQTKAMAVPMILLSTIQVLRETSGETRWDAFAAECVDTVLHDFLKPEEKALFEHVGPNGERLDSPQGRCINPGHSIETSWFLLKEGLYRKDNKLIESALQILDWSLELGWDKTHGGLLYFVDIEGRPAEQLEWDMKLWWPHTEALIALLLAHKITGRPEYERWYDKMHDWSFGHFEDKVHGDWYGYLHRDGSVANTLKGSMWKGPFHLPRALMLCMQLLGDM